MLRLLLLLLLLLPAPVGAAVHDEELAVGVRQHPMQAPRRQLRQERPMAVPGQPPKGGRGRRAAGPPGKRGQLTEERAPSESRGLGSGAEDVDEGQGGIERGEATLEPGQG